MFWHVFSYRLLTGIRDRQMLFWTLLFPLILATLFNFAFANLNEGEKFEAIPIAVVTNDYWEQDKTLQQVMTETSTGPDALFSLSRLDANQAGESLAQGKIAGYIIPGSVLEIVVKSSGLQQSVLKIFADEYMQTSTAIGKLLQQNPDLNIEAFFTQVPQSYIQNAPISSTDFNFTFIYFYALIAMACLYGGFWGLREVVAVKANLSMQAARVNLSPVPKMRQFIYAMSAAMLIQYLSILLLLVFLKLVIKIDFGGKIGFIMLASLIGSILGVLIGAFIGAISNLSEGIKTAQLIGFSMLTTFLSGLMMADMKYIVASNAPLLSWLNPANLISDAFYSLYFFENYNRYWLNMLAMLIFIIITGVVIFFKMRRQRYASI
jgi:ABC-2 type transport system permease protein